MIRAVNLRKARISRFVIFVAIVCALVWYVGLKRAEFLKGPVTKPSVAPVDASTEGIRAQKPETDYFQDSKVERERSRSQELERLRELMNNTQADPSTRREASARFLAISKETARESEIEHLVKAKGYEEVVVFMGNGSAVVVVKAAQITQTDVARIAEIVTQVAGVKPEALKVIARQ